MKKYQLMVDPTPYGWAYGFPRALPEEAVGGTGYDLWVRNDFDLTKWVCSYGYPEENFEYVKYYPQEIQEDATEEERVRVGSDEGGVMGDLKFTTAQDYIYPGSDPQE